MPPVDCADHAWARLSEQPALNSRFLLRTVVLTHVDSVALFPGWAARRLHRRECAGCPPCHVRHAHSRRCREVTQLLLFCDNAPISKRIKIRSRCGFYRIPPNLACACVENQPGRFSGTSVVASVLHPRRLQGQRSAFRKST